MTAASPGDNAAPAAAADRITELDVLRGVALFAVFLVNLTGFAGAGVMATESQLAALPTADIDRLVRAGIRWLAYDKANTMFAFLFGLGFWLQMERLTARGADFQRIYARRLVVLLALGIVHLFLTFTWDTLHTYAICGFILLWLRRARDGVLLVGGLTLAVFGRIAIELPVSLTGVGKALGANAYASDAAVLERQALSQAGDYLGLIEHFAGGIWITYILAGGLGGWILYALGRFFIGAWVGRRGWLQSASAHAVWIRKWMWVLLPAGLIGEALGQAIDTAARRGILSESGAGQVASTVVHMLATPVLVAGYVCAIVTVLQTKLGRSLLSPFAFVGRMALTNYVMQSLLIGFVLFGVGPGLGLAGGIGATAVLLAVVLGYAVQVVFSRLWLMHFAYGPLEWVWRALTYGEAPRLLLAHRSTIPAKPAESSRAE